jgi:Fumarase C C-terminus
MITLAAHDAGVTVIARVSGRLPCGAPFCGAMTGSRSFLSSCDAANSSDAANPGCFRPSSLRTYSMFSIARFAVFIAITLGRHHRSHAYATPSTIHAERCAVFRASRQLSYWLAGKSGIAASTTKASAIAHNANDEGITLRETALATGYIDAAAFDRIADPAAMAGIL